MQFSWAPVALTEYEPSFSVTACAQPHPHMLHVALWRNLDCLGVDEMNIVHVEITDVRHACK
jgi:hypothetical protein